MADISIDEAKAKIWTDDVNAEIEAVRGILKDVNSSLTTVAGSEDKIMQGIYKIGTTMESVWNNMCNKFEESQGKLREALAKIGQAVQQVVDDADSLKNKIG